MKNLPDKIYILHHEDYSDRRIFNAFTEKESSTDIEYICKDVLYKKIEMWLNKRHKHDRYTLLYLRKHFKEIINEIMDD